MKILYISDSILPSKTANSVHVMNMCHSLAKYNHQVYFLAVSPQEKELKNIDDVFKHYGIVANFNLIKLKTRYFKNKVINALYREFFTNRKIKRKIKQIQPDVCYGRQVFGCFFAANMGIKTYYEAHAPMWEIGLINKLYFNKLLKNKQLQHIFVISNALKKIYTNKTPDFKNITVLPDASVPIPSFSDKADLQKSTNGCNILYTGHLYKGRGIENIIYLAENLPEHDYYILGGNESDIDFWKKRTSQKNIHFLGYVSPANVYKYRNSADILLAPYQRKVEVFGNHETSKFMSPLKIFEYMSSKKPIICSDLPVLKEVLNKKNAILVAPEDFEKWKNAVIQISINDDLKNSLAGQAYNDFKVKYSWDQRAENVLNLIEK